MVEVENLAYQKDYTDRKLQELRKKARILLEGLEETQDDAAFKQRLFRKILKATRLAHTTLGPQQLDVGVEEVHPSLASLHHFAVCRTGE